MMAYEGMTAEIISVNGECVKKIEPFPLTLPTPFALIIATMDLRMPAIFTVFRKFARLP
jgi:hypothetical protein